MPFSQQQLERALDNAEFVPHFQPLVDLRSGEIHGFEILARWQHPTRGFVPPTDFIPLLEQHRLLNNLTAALLISAFHAVRTLPGSFGLSINLSPPQLHDPSLPHLLQLMAEEANFDLRRLTVELTETALVDDLALATRVAEDFKQRGMRLALDDFGTGYSSLLHLQSLPFDELKVDASFVRSIAQSRQSRKITAAVINLGLSLGLQTVGEGIEDQSQANLLAWQGCNLGQGYLYGRAVPAEQLASLLAQPPFRGVTTDVPADIGDGFISLDARPMERFSQLRAIYDSAPVALAFINTELRYVNLNQRLAQSNGRSVQAHLGRKVSEMLSPFLYNQVEPYLLRALQGESLTNIEFTKPSTVPGEPPRTLMVSYEPVRDEAAEILGVCLAIADITPLKQKDEALRESEDHYRHTVELNPQIPWVVDANGKLISISSRWTELTGMSTEDALNFGWTSIVHPDDLDASMAAIQRSLQTGHPQDFQHRILSAEGKWVWVRSRGYPRRDVKGNIVRWYGSVESIDEYKRATDELRASEATLRAVFDAAPVGIALIESATRRFLHANPRAEELTGCRLEPSRTWSHEGWQAFDTNGNPVPQERMPTTQAMREGKSTIAEDFFIIRPDGVGLWMNITAAPVHLENGTQWGVVLVLQDIDKSRREQQKLLELTRVLELIGESIPAPAVIV